MYCNTHDDDDYYADDDNAHSDDYSVNDNDNDDGVDNGDVPFSFKRMAAANAVLGTSRSKNKL